MPRPRIAIFYGGQTDNYDLSQETGYWMCQYIPRTKYDITPIEVTADGKWKVPLGNLPRTGPVKRVMHMLSQAVKPLVPSKALERLFIRPVSAMLTVVRGKGGDDGGLQSLGSTLSVPVIGSSHATCQQTHNKHLFTQAVSGISKTPRTMRFKASTPIDTIVAIVRDEFVPPLFVKSATQEGSCGVEYVDSMDELASAVQRIRAEDDILLQERLSGTELSFSLLPDMRGKIRTLPPTIIVPQKASFYDNLSKRRRGRATLHTPDSSHNRIIRQAEEIARDAYSELGCEGLMSIDMIANEKGLHLLEANTIPTFTQHTPLYHQMQASGLHPTAVLDSLIEQQL